MNEMELFVKARKIDSRIELSYNMCGKDKRNPNAVDTVISLGIGDALVLSGMLEDAVHKLMDERTKDIPVKVLSFACEGPHHQKTEGT